MELKGFWREPDRPTLGKIILPNGKESRVLAPLKNGVQIRPARCCICVPKRSDRGMPFYSICASCFEKARKG